MLTVPIIIVGFLLGVRFKAGPLGIVVFVAIAADGVSAFSGFGYAIALKTGNPGRGELHVPAVLSFLLLTTSYVPKSQLTGWLKVVAAWNPVTYLLEGPAIARVDRLERGVISRKRWSWLRSSAR